MSNIKIDDFNIKLIRNKRYKKLRLSYRGYNNIVLSAPKYTSIKECVQFVKSSNDWLIQNKPKEYELKDDMVYIFGEWNSSEENILNAWQDFIKNNQKNIISIYRSKLDLYINRTLPSICDSMKLYPSSITYGKSINTLGCCYSKTSKIRFSIRLALMPKYVIDSVIIHELSHLKYNNHSINFWELVKQNDINLKKTNIYLKQNSSFDRYLAEKLFRN